MRAEWVGAALTLVVAVVGCSGRTDVGGSGGTGGSSAFSCPAAPPADGSSCTPPGSDASTSLFGEIAHCSWGSDPRPTCRTTALCTAGHTWSVTQPNATGCATPPKPAACPSPPPTLGGTCSDATLSCWYDSGTRCWCSDCKGGSPYPICQTISPPEWACASPPSGCPTTMPQAGSPCSASGVDCGPDCNLSIVCQGGVWKWQKGSCPICASPDTPIETPTGERAIAELRAGDLVYSVDHGAIVPVPIARVASTPVFHHHVVRVVLDSGRTLEISAGHPTADGRTFGELRAGSALDAEHRVLAAEVVPYAYPRTYDILPESDTGTYFAAGAEIGSTLFSRR